MVIACKLLPTTPHAAARRIPLLTGKQAERRRADARSLAEAAELMARLLEGPGKREWGGGPFRACAG